ncbi:MAG: hypothetical protein LUO79_02560 [Methanomassiliicoccales archaeon]|nr:hypothetical protein [Methanomassiliicoccales archaeon]
MDLDPGTTFSYSREIKGLKVTEVFDGIVSWLKEEGATIDRMQRPTEIVALHGSLKALAIWKKNAEKTMAFKLSEAGDAVHVDITMEPASTEFGYDVYGYQRKIQAGWGQLAVELWSRLEAPRRDAPS